MKWIKKFLCKKIISLSHARPLIWVCLVVVFAWGANAYILIDIDDRGTVGDMFGVTTSLFSGLAFAGVIWAILLQREELKSQQGELELTRDVMESEKFENRFFQMIKLHNDIVNSTVYIPRTGRPERVDGRIAFRSMANKLLADRNNAGLMLQGKDADRASRRTRRNQVSNLYESFYNYGNNGDVLGHYFRNLYHIVRYVEANSPKEPHQYIWILRAQLSNSEQILLFYNCLSRPGKGFYRPVNRWNLFHNLNRDTLLDENDYVLHYSLRKEEMQNAETPP